MKKLIAAFVFTALIFVVGCNKNNQTNPSNPGGNSQLLTTKQINDIIWQQLSQNGSFDWKNVSDEVIWSALQHSDHILSVGYKPVDESNVEDRLTQINIKENKWQFAKQQVLQLIYKSENNAPGIATAMQAEVWKENVLPVMDVYVTNINTIKLLRASNLVRYAEPMGYDPGTYEKNFLVQPGVITSSNSSSGSGCGGYVADNTLVNGVDYSVVAPNAEVSWNYSYQQIQSAWTKSTGQGVTVMIIDTGVSPDQNNLGSGFNQGYSSGRTIEKMVTLPGGTIDDVCGHGTAMAGECGAPRGTVGASCGVAYNCNLITCHAAVDVYLDQSKEVKGVSDAFTWAGNNDTVKIVSMSMGRITNSSQMADAIKYAYGKGKLIFCAGGTSFSWVASWWGVIFPATMKQVQAITGVQDNLTNVQNCTDCHQGQQISFVIVMERQSDGGHPITLAMTGNVPTTVGGSSVSTSTAAGIAALVWSVYPSYTSAQIVTKLQQSSSYYPNKNANYGYGIINANLATN